MTNILKVTEEEFDAEGNLTRRTVTEYGEPKTEKPDYRSLFGHTTFSGVA